jgi:tripartite ATP-independent transporter DctP family solute receptor
MIKLISLIFGALVLVVHAPAQSQTKLRAWNIHGDGYPVTEAVNSFAQAINKGTNGKYQLDVFSNGVLGDQPKAVQMLKSGEVDVAEFSSGPLSDAVPGLKVLNLPFLFTDSAHMFRHLDGKLGTEFADKLKAAGFVVVGWYDGGARSFYCINPVSSIADLGGKKIRVQQSDVYIELIKLLDSTPASVPFKDVLSSLEQNKIDCAENNMPSYDSTGHYKIAKNLYITNHVISAEALVVSTKLWDKLTQSEKDLFMQEGKKSALLMRDLWSKRVATAIETTTKQGVKVNKLKDSAGMIRRLSPLYNKYMNDPLTRKELLTIIAN